MNPAQINLPLKLVDLADFYAYRSRVGEGSPILRKLRGRLYPIHHWIDGHSAV